MKIFGLSGQLRQLAHIVVDGQDVAQLGGLDVSIGGHAEVSIVVSVPGVSGG